MKRFRKWLSNLVGKYYWCRIGKHKRGVLVWRTFGERDVATFACPRCHATWDRKVRKPKGDKE